MNVKRNAKDFPVVCVDISAGGLDAYTHLLRHRPALDRVTGIVKELRSTLQSITHFFHYR